MPHSKLHPCQCFWERRGKPPNVSLVSVPLQKCFLALLMVCTIILCSHSTLSKSICSLSKHSPTLQGQLCEECMFMHSVCWHLKIISHSFHFLFFHCTSMCYIVPVLSFIYHASTSMLSPPVRVSFHLGHTHKELSPCDDKVAVCVRTTKLVV